MTNKITPKKILLQNNYELSVMVHVCNPRTQESEEEDHLEFQASMGYIAKFCLKEIKNNY